MLIIGTKESRYEYTLPFNKKEFSTPFINKIEYIVANGQELEGIKQVFCHNWMTQDNELTHPLDRIYTIPITNNLSTCWWGDIAKTIIANL